MLHNLGRAVAARLMSRHVRRALPVALLLAILIPAIVGVLIEKLAIEPVKGAETVTLIIITIGASLVIRGLTSVIFGKGTHSLPAFSGETPIDILGATLMPQSLDRKSVV